MTGTPLPYLLNRAAAALSLAVLVSGLWFIADGLHALPRPTGWLALGAALVGLSFLGRYPILKMFPPAARPAPPPAAGKLDAIVGAGGAHLHVERYGPADGWPIVLVQGFETDRTVWEPMLPALAEHHHVLVWDLPGVGLSERPFDEVYSLERVAADLGAVLQLADGRPALLVGWSTGAAAVLARCRANPESLGASIAGVALLNPALAPPATGAMVQADLVLSPLVQAMNWTAYLNGTLHLTARSTALGAAPSREAADAAARQTAGASPWVQAKGALALKEADLAAAAERLTVPVLVAAGGCDLAVPPVEARGLADSVPGAEFALIEGVGHAGPLERPDLYAGAVNAFADKVFARVEQLARPRAHAEVLRRAPSFYQIGPEPSSFADGFEPAPVEDEAEAGRRIEGFGPTAGRA